MTNAPARIPPTLVVTTESIPTFEIVAVIGEVCGSTATPCDPYATGVKLLTGRVNPGGSQELARARDQAVAQMVAEARRRGANAVIGMRFDNRTIGRWAEICAYGTAVRVRAAASTSGRHSADDTKVRVPAARVPAVASSPSQTRSIDWVALDRSAERTAASLKEATRPRDARG